MREPGEPTLAESEQGERFYQAFCRRYLLDPEATESMVEFEVWWEWWLVAVDRIPVRLAQMRYREE